jgi:hypothetical protein
MPGGSKYEGSPEKLAQYTAVVERSESNVEVKGAKNPYTSRNGHMFSFLTQDGSMALRLSAELGKQFTAEYESGPVMQYGSVMRGYVSVPAELLAKPAQLAPWFDRSWDSIGSLSPKPTKKK